MLQYFLVAALAAAQPTAASPATGTSIRALPAEFLVNECLKLQSGSVREDLKQLAAELQELAKQKQHLRDLLQQMLREEQRLGGVGPMTVAMLLKNTVRSAELLAARSST